MKHRYTQLIKITKVLMGPCNHEVTVRYINGRYHVRVFVNEFLNQEAVCESKENIGFTARSLLRWEDKVGNISDFATSARRRHNQKDFI